MAAVRVAVRRALHDVVGPGQRILVACSGGADSLALAAATAFEAPRYGVSAGCVTVDHGLQEDSAKVALRARDLAAGLGLRPALVREVDVAAGGGPEAAARRARYRALGGAAVETGAAWVLLGHTRDDQAETVLLGLGRGSGPRSVAGMRAADSPWLRPLLDVPRSATRAACAAEGLPVWEDPHNADPRFTRSRLRHELLPLMEDVLGDGVAGALARTAEMLRADLDALDALADDLVRVRLRPATHGDSVRLDAFTGLHPALRTRLVRAWLLDLGVRELTSVHVRATDALVGAWHGQGPVALPGGHAVERVGRTLRLRRMPPSPDR